MVNRHNQRTHAFTLIEIMVVIAIIGILAGLAVPNFMRSRSESQLAACKQNLRDIATAVEIYMIRHRSDSDLSYISGRLINDEHPLYVEKYLNNVPHCPGNGGYYQLFIDSKQYVIRDGVAAQGSSGPSHQALGINNLEYRSDTGTFIEN